MAEGTRFELAADFCYTKARKPICILPLSDLESAAINHSAIPPYCRLETPTARCKLRRRKFELPHGKQKVQASPCLWCPHPDSNRDAIKALDFESNMSTNSIIWAFKRLCARRTSCAPDRFPIKIVVKVMN